MAKSLVMSRNDGPIAIIELSNPPANCYSYDMMRQLDEAILAARFDESVHVIVLRGAGDKFFCAGADIGMLGDVTAAFKYAFCLHANETLNRLEQTPKLTIAALNGHCVGGGFEVALACDLRVARKGGGKVGLPEVNLGVLPGTGGTQRFARLVGKSKAIEWMATGRTFSFDEALEHGLVNHVWESDGFFDRVVDYARDFAPPKRAAKAVGLIKRSVQSGVEVGFHEGLALERELQQQLFLSEDAREGIAAYLEKRPGKVNREARRSPVGAARQRRIDHMSIHLTNQADDDLTFSTVTIDNPPLNVLDLDHCRDLTSCLQEVHADDRARVVILRGAGDSFSAGVDIKQHTAEQMPQLLPAFHQVFDSLLRLRAVTVAAVQGHCLGGGAELAFACDRVIATDDARFGFPEIQVGCYPPVALSLLPYRAGHGGAVEMIIGGAEIELQRFVSWGMVHGVAKSGTLDDALDLELARYRGKSPEVTALAAALLHEEQRRAWGDRIRYFEQEYLENLLPHPDVHEGIAAFNEKRSPVWKQPDDLVSSEDELL